jgi:cellulose synthase/poly-beta-1,6-N-acetylglucosamine synthase-like glycosyltransferase
MRVCVGLMAYNEGENIASSLRSLLDQHGPHLTDLSVVVVASGCTDDTVARARHAAGDDRRVRIIEQPRREGKAAAIGVLLGEARGSDVVAVAGADTVAEPGALEALVAPFDDQAVGMTGGRPVPINDPGSVMGRVVHLLWDLHHAMALERPKLGELVAFRPFFASLASTAVDEAAVEALVRARGLRLVYVPEARVRMKGPCSVPEFLAQRRRIHAGHLRLSRTQSYRVSTLSTWRVLGVAWRARSRGAAGWTTLLAAAVLEATARGLGWWDERVAGRRHEIWERIPSTKDLAP